MNWRWSFAWSKATAILASSLIWIVVASMASPVVGVFALISVVVVAGWRTQPMLKWRYGARRIDSVEAAAVWRALVQIEWPRGRSLPCLRSSDRLGADIAAPGPNQLVLGDKLLDRLARHAISDQEVRRLVVRALGVADVNRSRLVAAVELLCLPWSVLAIVARTLSRPVAAAGLVRFGWRARWLFFAIAAFDLWGHARWPGLAMLALAAVATVTTPILNRAWADRLLAMADAFEHEHAGPITDSRVRQAGPGGRPGSRTTASHSGGVR